MNRRRSWRSPVIVLVLAVLVFPIIFFLPRGSEKLDDPWAGVPERIPSTDHSALMKGPFPDGPSVTRACLECHPDAANDVMQTAHWKWEGDPVLIPGHTTPIAIGKKILINNFCIGIQSNWSGCTSCHPGYGWVDESFSFDDPETVDCLACHERSGNYAKTDGGYPAEDVDLLAVAKSVGRSSRENCGSCHFRGGGGGAVKHGDLDPSLINPRERVDVHMGRHGMTCIDCHKTTKHLITGRSISVSVDRAHGISCTDCHSSAPHADERINGHTGAVACQTCHIPEVAIREATKMHWDWSAAGQDLEEDSHAYLKIKGSFEYEKGLRPEYYWFNGEANRYLLGDKIDPSAPTAINMPRGGIADATARIWPFKVHRGNQIYDTQHKHFLVPKAIGEGGYRTEFDWDRAVRLGSVSAGIEYSGEYGFAPTEMYWPLSHMVTDRTNVLQCRDCHDEGGLMDWKALGYSGDPIHWGGRAIRPVVVLMEPAR